LKNKRVSDTKQRVYLAENYISTASFEGHMREESILEDTIFGFDNHPSEAPKLSFWGGFLKLEFDQDFSITGFLILSWIRKLSTKVNTQGIETHAPLAGG
jgi:hypothetical protein